MDDKRRFPGTGSFAFTEGGDVSEGDAGRVSENSEMSPVEAVREITCLKVLLQEERTKRHALEASLILTKRTERILDDLARIDDPYELFGFFLEEIPHLMGRGSRTYVTRMSDYLNPKTSFASRGAQITDLAEMFRHGIHEYLIRRNRVSPMREDGKWRNFEILLGDLRERHPKCDYFALRIENPRELNGNSERFSETLAYLEMPRFPDPSEGDEDAAGQMHKIMRGFKSKLETLQGRILIEEHFRLACEDPLTGLRNRRGFFEAVASLRKRDPDAPFSIIAADLDKFKSVNDTYGHDVGDLVLKAFSRHVGTAKAMGEQRLVPARFGGEEFVAYCHGMRCEDAARIAEKIRLKAAKHPVPTEKGAVTVTASLGVAGCRSAKENVEEVMERADALLYLAKEGGRNQVRKSLVDEALRVRDEKKASDAIEAGIETNRRSNWISILHDMMSER